jgi:hypothetical protein
MAEILLTAKQPESISLTIATKSYCVSIMVIPEIKVIVSSSSLWRVSYVMFYHSFESVKLQHSIFVSVGAAICFVIQLVANCSRIKLFRSSD